MRARLFCVVWCAALGCGRPPLHAPRPSRLPVNSGVVSQPGNGPAELRRTFTGQARPSLVVENGFPIAQHVFVDWVESAVLAPATSRSIELEPGTHTITCADSPDPDDHPAAVSEGFEAGYTYVYRLRPGP